MVVHDALECGLSISQPFHIAAFQDESLLEKQSQRRIILDNKYSHEESPQEWTHLQARASYSAGCDIPVTRSGDLSISLPLLLVESSVVRVLETAKVPKRNLKADP